MSNIHPTGDNYDTSNDVDDEVDDPNYIRAEDIHMSASCTNSRSADENHNTTVGNIGLPSAEFRGRKKEQLPVLSSFSGPAFSEVSDIHSPYKYFKHFFDDELLKHIAEQTNIYCAQEKTSKNLRCKCIDTDKDEIEQLIGVLLFMGIYPNSQYRVYWSQASPMPQITKALEGGVNRFESLKRFLHFNNNENIPDRSPMEYDKLYKVRPVINSVLEKCKALENEEYNSIDEQMIPTKCKSSIKQYLPKKTHKWGYKVFTRCGASGIVYNFEIFVGKSPNNQPPSSLGITGDLVMRLCENMQKHQNYKLCFDNYFTSLPVLKKLQEHGILALGTFEQTEWLEHKSSCPVKKS